MTDSARDEVAALLQAMLQQQTAMLQLQRVLVERLLGATKDTPRVAPTRGLAAAAVSSTLPDPGATAASESPASLGDQNVARGARYYQPRSSPAANMVKPEELELMWRLQEMRDAGDLILQFGPYMGTTLAQVALNHPEYVRELVTRAHRPEVRAAAGRLVEALDAAAEHKRKTTRGTTRRGRSPR